MIELLESAFPVVIIAVLFLFGGGAVYANLTRPRNERKRPHEPPPPPPNTTEADEAVGRADESAEAREAAVREELEGDYPPRMADVLRKRRR